MQRPGDDHVVEKVHVESDEHDSKADALCNNPVIIECQTAEVIA